MSTIQNLKNFIRHGKQARTGHSPHAEPTTDISNVHAQQQRYNKYTSQLNHVGVTEPNLAEQKGATLSHGAAGGYSVAAVENRNVVARAHDAVAHAEAEKQKLHQKKAEASGDKKDYDPSVIERIVAEERESQGKLPRYPGLERWTLIEKMGDGAFSNVYRAKDTHGQYPEVAIKVVRKFEMNSSQVCMRNVPDCVSPYLFRSYICLSCPSSARPCRC